MSGPTPRPGILDIELYIGGKSALDGQGPVIKLSSNEGALGPSPKAVAAYREVAGALHLYPDIGSTELREAIAAQHGLDPARIVCGNGSDELLSLLAKGYAGPGDEVIITEHGFAMYPIVTLAAGATPVTASERGLAADVDTILDRVTAKTRMVFLASPNNPTGSYVPRDELRRLRAALREDVLLVVDAAYAEYISREDYTDGAELVESGDNVVMTRTFSKAYALAALRLGWAYCPPSVAGVLNRMRIPFNVTLPAQAAGTAAVNDVAHREAGRAHNDVWLPWFAQQLSGLGLEPAPSVANFVLVRFPDDPAKCADAAEKFLNGHGIIPRAVASYGLPESLRITIGRGEDMKTVIAALGEFMG